MLAKKIHEGISDLLGVRFIVGAVVGIALAAGVTFVVLRPSSRNIFLGSQHLFLMQALI